MSVSLSVNAEVSTALGIGQVSEVQMQEGETRGYATVMVGEQTVYVEVTE